MIADEIEKLKRLLDQGAITAEEFARAKERLLNGEQAAAESAPSSTGTVNRFRLSVTDRWIGGVCGGLGSLTGVESWIWRLGFTLSALVFGSGFLIYLLLWFFVPRADQS
ncbi:MAG: PspC domain-containing protein [Betaproteobacteria bacterium]|nr:PspC domain-containing protein [Betaproteobacteria bacterium]